jgi:hypothetical protein
MRYDSPTRFITTLLTDLETLTNLDKKNRRKLIKVLRDDETPQSKGSIPSGQSTSAKQNRSKKRTKRSKTTEKSRQEEKSPAGLTLPDDIDDLIVEVLERLK